MKNYEKLEYSDIGELYRVIAAASNLVLASSDDGIVVYETDSKVGYAITEKKGTYSLSPAKDMEVVKDLAALYHVVAKLEEFVLTADREGYQTVFQTSVGVSFHIRPNEDKGVVELLPVAVDLSGTDDTLSLEGIVEYISGLDDVRKFTQQWTGYGLFNGIGVAEVEEALVPGDDGYDPKSKGTKTVRRIRSVDGDTMQVYQFSSGSLVSIV